jgi:hypothetical protein
MHAETYHTTDATAFANFAKTVRKQPKPAAADCEVMALAFRLGAAMKRFDDMQAQPITPATRTAIKQAEEQAWDEAEALRDMISNVKVRSPIGANVQIAEALDRFEMIVDQFPKEAENYRVRLDVRAVRRLLHSALDFYDAVASRKLADVTPQLGSRSLSPWQPIEITTQND